MRAEDRNRARSTQAGLTLIEVLVALMVFSVAVLAIFRAGGENARAHLAMEERTLAGVVAENRMVEAVLTQPAPDLGVSRGETELAGRRWEWTQTIARTADEGVRRIDISVSAEDGEQALATLTGFRGAGL
ncbi:MAG: type II secretion system minor pseudopilin GspI [Pseudomonadota bacterium]